MPVSEKKEELPKPQPRKKEEKTEELAEEQAEENTEEKAETGDFIYLYVVVVIDIMLPNSWIDCKKCIISYP